MAFLMGIELVALLPDGTAVTEAEATRFINAAKSRLGESHITSEGQDPLAVLPENDLTRDLVEQMAYARAIERHYVKGEGAIEVPVAKEALERAEAAFMAYDARYSTGEEQAIEAPVAYVGWAPF